MRTEVSFLVSFEGGDGAGKSYFSRELHRRLSLTRSCALVDPKRPQFADEYVQKHAVAIAVALWEGKLSGTRNRLGTPHWVHLSAAWFHLVDEHILQPAMGQHEVVILDSWFHKLLARFALKGMQFYAEAARAYRRLSVPDATILLDVTPSVAVRRKSTLGYAECGNFDGYSGISEENFIAYQEEVRAHLLRLGRRSPRWRIISADSPDRDTIVQGIETALKEPPALQ